MEPPSLDILCDSFNPQTHPQPRARVPVIVKGYETEVVKTMKLAQLDRVKTVFFSNVSHELRTPLMLILGPLDDILNNEENPISVSMRAQLQVVATIAH